MLSSNSHNLGACEFLNVMNDGKRLVSNTASKTVLEIVNGLQAIIL